MNTFIRASTMLALTLPCLSPLSEAAEVFEITQFTFDDMSPTIAVAADNDDDAVAVLEDFDVIYGTFSVDGTEWAPLVPLSSGAGVSFFPDVAMDATGTALAIWVRDDSAGSGNSFIETSFFANGTWTPILPPLETAAGTPFFRRPSIAMNGAGKGVAAWINVDLVEAHASLFSNGVWSPFQVIGVTGNGMKVDYSANGTAAATWAHFDLGINDIWANNFNGTVWTGPFLLDNSGNSFPDIGMDDNGNAIAIWNGDFNNTVKVSRFNGVSWSPGLAISPGINNADPHIAVAPDGTAVAVWPDSTSVIQMSLFNGTAWSPATPIAGGPQVAITMDSVGNALIGWTTTLDQFFTALLLKGATTIGPPVFITTFSGELTSLDLALSSGSTLGFPVWNERQGPESPGDTFGTFIAFGPTPPSNIEGRTCTVNGSSHGDRVNIITWTPSTDPTVVSYRVLRDGVLVAIIPAVGPFVFFDHDRCRGVPNTYSVVAVNAEGITSLPLTITLN